MLDNLRIFYNFLLFSDIDLGSNARSGRQGKSLDFDDYSDEEEDETLETLRRLLSPSELSRLREKVFGGGDKEKQKGRRRRGRRRRDEEGAAGSGRQPATRAKCALAVARVLPAESNASTGSRKESIVTGRSGGCVRRG